MAGLCTRDLALKMVSDLFNYYMASNCLTYRIFFAYFVSL